MSDGNAGPRAPAGTSTWVWIAAAIVALLLAGGGVFWWMRAAHKPAVAETRPHLLGVMGETVTELDAAKPDMDKLCAASLKRALDFGVLPPGASLVKTDADAASAEGRYACEAQGGGGKYLIGVDTTCAGSKEADCFALDSVKREDDGTVLYQRRSWPG
ncbi:MAG TPA: hypothetical protein VHC42_00600 [Rhizomicrobium sp.]|nr:hypothetical protein [Rhizomicrobium sp.]